MRETIRTVRAGAVGGVKPRQVHPPLVDDIIVDQTHADDAEQEDLVRRDERDEDGRRAEQVPRVDPGISLFDKMTAM